MKMESNLFEINLNTISSNEHMSQSEESYGMEYLPIVIGLLGSESKHLFEEDLLDRYLENTITLAEILEQNKTIVRGPNLPNPRKQGRWSPTYYDTWIDMVIEPANRFYDYFFAYHLKHMDLLKMDEYLTYYLEKYYEKNLDLFSRFLQLTIRKFKVKIIPEETILTIQEWIASFEAKQKAEKLEGSNGSDRYKSRTSIRRRADDNETILNQAQTVLLIHYLQKKGIFLRNHLLTDADAGKAFELLTGYSMNTLRQDLGKYHNFQNPENLKKLKHVLIGITDLIDNELKGKSPKP
ncbi:MAG: hypothetical protein ACOYXT_18965 [Bacteroidota bacterium]